MPSTTSSRTDNLGVVPPAFLTELIGVIDSRRPFLGSTRRLPTPDSGMKLIVPVINQRPTAAVQATEKTEVSSQKTLIGTDRLRRDHHRRRGRPVAPDHQAVQPVVPEPVDRAARRGVRHRVRGSGDPGAPQRDRRRRRGHRARSRGPRASAMPTSRPSTPSGVRRTRSGCRPRRSGEFIDAKATRTNRRCTPASRLGHGRRWDRASSRACARSTSRPSTPTART